MTVQATSSCPAQFVTALDAISYCFSQVIVACWTGAASGASETAPGSMAASVSACDFQWSGGGLAATDVMYLLWTSVSPTIIRDCEDDLLR